MEKAEFDDYFAVLDKASDRARSVIYVFIIVYIAVLLYGLNAFAYPARQYTYDNMNLQVRCRYHRDDSECNSLKKLLSTAERSPQLDDAIEKNLWSHELQLFYDDSVAVRTFKFPIFGLETDRDLLWLIFPFIGMIGYYIVWLVLGRLATTFRFLLNSNQSDPVRLRLIQSIVVITTPLNPEHGEMSPFYQVVWRTLASLVFVIPVIVTLLTIADQTNAIPTLILHRKGEHLFEDSTIPAIVRVMFDALVLLLQLGLFSELIALGRRFGRDQRETERLIGALEHPPSSNPA